MILNFFPPIDVFNENWMTTPMSLPLTPDESTGTTMTYTTTPTFSGHTPVSVPLTPESLVSPQSSTEGEELEEVLSYFADSANQVQGQDFGTEAASGYSTPHVYQDSEYCLFALYRIIYPLPNDHLSIYPLPCIHITLTKCFSFLF